MRAVEAVEHFAQSGGPVGTAYQAIHHKEILHLALLLHDLGKGFEEDHSEVGKRLAEDVSDRLQLPDHQRDQLVFLVHKHLMMSNWAFRRDLSDPETLLQFSREVGTPDTLRMLYVLTAADLFLISSYFQFPFLIHCYFYCITLQIMAAIHSKAHLHQRILPP